MSYGFDDGSAAPISLPKTKEKPAATKQDLKTAAEAGKVLGFVSREAGQPKRKTGRKQTEPQGKMLITGPERVLERLKSYCDANGHSAYWHGLEELLERAGG